MNLKEWFYSKYNVLLSAVLTLLGFSSCDSIGDPFNGVCLYGSPHARYDVKGTVQSEEGNALQGITVTTKVVLLSADGESFSHELQKSDTEAKGQYQHRGDWQGHPDDQRRLRVVAEDPKGIYAADSVDVQLTHTNEGKDTWCSGTDSGKADFRLKRVEKQ